MFSDLCGWESLYAGTIYMTLNMRAWRILYSGYPAIGHVAGVDISGVLEREVLSC